MQTAHIKHQAARNSANCLSTKKQPTRYRKQADGGASKQAQNQIPTCHHQSHHPRQHGRIPPAQYPMQQPRHRHGQQSQHKQHRPTQQRHSSHLLQTLIWCAHRHHVCVLSICLFHFKSRRYFASHVAHLSNNMPITTHIRHGLLGPYPCYLAQAACKS